MLAFYVGTGVVLALFLGGWFAWTPLRIAYYERSARTGHTGEPPDDLTTTKGLHAIYRLVEIGPRAEPALRRLLRSESRDLRYEVASALRIREAQWTIPLLVLAAQDRDRDIAQTAMWGVEPVLHDGLRFRSTEELLSWWHREGKAKYGSGE
jgi:hypothetical protein